MRRFLYRQLIHSVINKVKQSNTSTHTLKWDDHIHDTNRKSSLGGYTSSSQY